MFVILMPGNNWELNPLVIKFIPEFKFPLHLYAITILLARFQPSGTLIMEVARLVTRGVIAHASCKFDIIYGILVHNWCNHSAVHVNSQAKAMAYWGYPAMPPLPRRQQALKS
jgi:hypothetical protein